MSKFDEEIDNMMNKYYNSTIIKDPFENINNYYNYIQQEKQHSAFLKCLYSNPTFIKETRCSNE